MTKLQDDEYFYSNRYSTTKSASQLKRRHPRSGQKVDEDEIDALPVSTKSNNGNHGSSDLVTSSSICSSTTGETSSISGDDDTDDEKIRIKNTSGNKKSFESYDKQKIPYLLKQLLRLYRSLPKKVLFIPVPYFVDIHHAKKVRSNQVPDRWRKTDVTFTFSCMFVFVCIDYFVASVLRQYTTGFNTAFEPELRMIAGSITTILHSTILVTLLTLCLYHNDILPTVTNTPTNVYSNRFVIWVSKFIPSLPIFQQKEKWWQDTANAILEFCTGYMLYDAFVQFFLDRINYHNSVWRPVDWLFLGHHGATALYMASARWCQAGHLSAMALMLFGEMTAPIMNILRISFTIRSYATLPTTSTHELQVLANLNWLTQTLHPKLEYFYAVLYFIIRAIIGPIVILHITYDLLLTSRGRKNVPLFVSIIWLSLCWAVSIGSYAWIVNCWKVIITGESRKID